MSTNGHATNEGLMIELAPGAEVNAFATMLADLVRQNIESKPHKRKDFDALDGKVALVAEDADVALTLEFTASATRRRRRLRRPRALLGPVGRVFSSAAGSGTGDPPGRLMVHDGIKGVPDVTVRGSADAIMALSNVPLTRPLALPLPTDGASLEVVRGMLRAARTGELKIHGIFGNLGLLSRLTRVMSVNG